MKIEVFFWAQNVSVTSLHASLSQDVNNNHSECDLDQLRTHKKKVQLAILLLCHSYGFQIRSRSLLNTGHHHTKLKSSRCYRIQEEADVNSFATSSLASTNHHIYLPDFSCKSQRFLWHPCGTPYPHAVFSSFKDLLAVLQPPDPGLRNAGDRAVQVHSYALRYSLVLQLGCEVWRHLELVATGGSRL